MQDLYNWKTKCRIEVIQVLENVQIITHIEDHFWNLPIDYYSYIRFIFIICSRQRWENI